MPIRRWFMIALLAVSWLGLASAQGQDTRVVAVMTGDSIEAGHGTDYKTPMDDGGPGGDISAELGYQMRRKIGPSFVYRDIARGGTRWAWIRWNALSIITAVGAQETWIHTGVNDVMQRTKWEDIEKDMNAVYDGTSGPLFIDEILPAAYLNDTMAATIRSFNKHYAEWAKDKPRVVIVECWAAFGELRPSTKQLDNLKKKFDSKDLLHINALGAEALAGLRCKARAKYYAAHPVTK